MLLVNLLGIVSGVNSYGIVMNLIQLFWISAGKGQSDVIVKDIEKTPLFRPRLLKSLEIIIELFKDRKTHLNATATL